MASIDIGSAATDRASTQTLCTAGNQRRTVVDYNNPANAQGEITSVELWLNTVPSPCILFLMTVYETASGWFAIRDSDTAVGLSAGSKQTCTVSLEVCAGDYIAVEGEDTGELLLDAATSGGSGTYAYAGGLLTNYGVGVAKEFTLTASGIVSLYGTGETAPNIKVKVQPKDPYTVQVASLDPYVVKLAPKDPYTVVILEDE